MKKIVTVAAATLLAASSFAFAEQTNANSNDVLQSLPQGAQQVADANSDNTAAAAPASNATDNNAKKVKKHRHHAKKHNKKHHQNVAAAKTAPAADAVIAPSADAAPTV